ncbi:MAG: CBS domain-containing protein [Desulfovibrionaceae bacterium]
MPKAKDIMTTDPITLAPDMEISAAVRILLERGVNGAPVLNKQGEVLGVLCQSDLIAQQKTLALPSFFTLLDGLIPLSSEHEMEREMKKIAATTVEDAMSQPAVTVGPETPIEEIANIMVDRKLYTLPVVQNGELVGVVGKEDLLRTLIPE